MTAPMAPPPINGKISGRWAAGQWPRATKATRVEAEQHQGRHNREATADPGDACEQTHQHALARQSHGPTC